MLRVPEVEISLVCGKIGGEVEEQDGLDYIEF